jgi:hypothetical protein
MESPAWHGVRSTEYDGDQLALDVESVDVPMPAALRALEAIFGPTARLGDWADDA